MAEKKAKSRIILAVVVVLVGAGVVAALWPRAIVVDTAVVDKGTMVVTLDEEARTRVIARAMVTAPVAGNLVVTGIRAGDVVEEGQVLARLEPAAPPLLDAAGRAELSAAVRASEAGVEQARAVVARVEASLETTRGNVERQQKLVAAGGAPRVALDDAKALAHNLEHELESARFAVRVAQEQLTLQRASFRRATTSGAGAGGLLELRSPLAGVVLEVARDHDGLIAPGTPIMEVGEAHSIEVRAPVLTNEAVQIVPGTEVVVKGWGGKDLPGHVRAVEPKAFTRVSALGVEEQRTHVVIDIDVPTDAVKETRLGDGWAVQASIVRWRGDDVVRAPAGALFRRGDGWGAFVLEGGRAVERTVKPDHRAGALVEIVEGLGAGDVVVLYPGERVTNDLRVTPRERAGDGAK